MAKKKRPRIEDLASFTEKFGNESDRGAALIGAALLDGHLCLLIASFLIDDKNEVNELLGINSYYSPLGTFSARIRAAYCLGLISRDEFHDLRIIQRIRNAFAHELDSSSFGSEQIRDRCNSLRTPQRRQWHPSLSPRECFSFATSALSISLESRTRRAKRERRQAPSESDALS